MPSLNFYWMMFAIFHRLSAHFHKTKTKTHNICFGLIAVVWLNKKSLDDDPFSQSHEIPFKTVAHKSLSWPNFVTK